MIGVKEPSVSVIVQAKPEAHQFRTDMQQNMRPGRRRTYTGIRRHAGSYAVEYALIFPVFFVLLYGTIAYGLIFAMRLGLQHAAEEGARAALRYQLPTNPGDSQITLRESAAAVVATTAADWVAGLGSVEVSAEVCLISDTDCLPVFGTERDDNVDCGDTLADGCQIVVKVDFPYDASPIFPSIPGFGLLMPSTISGRARAVLDGRAMVPL